MLWMVTPFPQEGCLWVGGASFDWTANKKKTKKTKPKNQETLAVSADGMERGRRRFGPQEITGADWLVGGIMADVGVVCRCLLIWWLWCTGGLWVDGYVESPPHFSTVMPATEKEQWHVTAGQTLIGFNWCTSLTGTYLGSAQSTAPPHFLPSFPPLPPSIYERVLLEVWLFASMVYFTHNHVQINKTFTALYGQTFSIHWSIALLTATWKHW